MQNQLILGDSLLILKQWYKEGKKEFIDLNYNDPPFNSNRDYNILFDPKTDTSELAFEDTWLTIKYYDLMEDFKYVDLDFYQFLKNLQSILPNDSFKSYISTMGIIYWYIYKMIKDTGCIYHHCDPITNSYMKIVLDKIFGLSNFRNEIVWNSVSNISGPKSNTTIKFARSHDIILFYTKSNKFKLNKQYGSFTIDEIKKYFKFNDNDGKGSYSWQPIRFKISEEKKMELIEKNEYWKAGDGNKSKYDGYKKYFKTSLGKPIGDLWNDIMPISTGSNSEWEQYPTQKPEKLLERIILSSSNENNLVVDLFNGGGTTVTTCVKLKRNFIGIDINYRSIQMTKERLENLKMLPKDGYHIFGLPTSSKELRELVDQNIYGKQSNSKFALEEVTIKNYLYGVTGNKKQIGDNSIDGKFFFEFDGKNRIGLVQVTSTANMNHFKAFCSEILSGIGDIGVYITFENTLTKGIIKKAKEYGRIGNVDKIQILTFEDLIDNKKQYKIPRDLLIIEEK